MSSLSTTLRVVRVNDTDPDPALDLAAMKEHVRADDPESPTLLWEYMRTRDEQHLRFKEGMTPTWFHVRRLPGAYLTRQLDAVYPLAERLRLATAASVHLIEGSDGTALRCVPEKDAAKGDPFVSRADAAGVDVAPHEWTQELLDRWGAEIWAELGTIAITQSRLQRGRRGPFHFWGGTVLTP